MPMLREGLRIFPSSPAVTGVAVIVLELVAPFLFVIWQQFQDKLSAIIKMQCFYNKKHHIDFF